MSNKIFRLSEHTINQIAAGEVIENPASVLKELIENAIDAGATHIVIETLGGGFELLKVSDNGGGMTPEDAALCLERHATSKIKEVDDLNTLETMGFRGEALSSISSISKMTLLTCHKEIATRVEVHGGKIVDIKRGARSQGTTIEVRFLFYNVPARKKFQKSERASTAEMTKVITQLSLAHPECGFELFHQGEKVLSFSSSEGLSSRIAHLFSENEEMLAINLPVNRWKVEGVIGSPLSHRPNRLGQYLFINRRPVVSLSLSFAIREVFGTRLDKDRHPIYALHLTLPPEEVDVNVHPQKKEVRFFHEKELKEELQRVILMALHQERAPLEEREIPATFPSINWDFLPKMAEEEFSCGLKLQEAAVFQEVQLEIPDPSLAYAPICLGVWHSYVLVDEEEGLLLIDLEAALEKIYLETSVLKEEKKLASEFLLVPIMIPLSVKESAWVGLHLEALKNIGFDARMLGKATLCLESIPAGIPLDSIEEYVRYVIAENLSEDFESLANVTASFTHRGKKKFSLQEAQEIVVRLLKTPNPKVGSQGKPTMIILRLDEIKRRFT